MDCRTHRGCRYVCFPEGPREERLPAIPEPAFASRLGGLSHREFVQFIAARWDASGWETTVESPVVHASRNGTGKRLLVLPPRRLRQETLYAVARDGTVYAFDRDDGTT